MPEHLHFLVPAELSDARLDRALSELASSHSRSAIARLIESGHVSVDTEVVTKASHRLREGQTVALQVPDPTPVGIVAQDLPISILWEDEDLVVVDKPAGLVVHPAAGHADETLVNALLHHIKDLSGIGGELRPGIVHRLDKDTTGVLLVAKNDSAHRALTEAWNTPAVRKEYTALVYGTPAHSKGTVEAALGRDPRDRKKMAVVRDGRAAITDYIVEERYRFLSLLRLSLRTGRTHQIRVHLKHLGHPIVGDPLYSGPQWKGMPDKKLQKTLAAVTRQMLHASKISFVHPRTSERVVVEAAMPADMRGLIDTLRSPL